MNANYLTPHQFGSIQDNFDTLLVSGYTAFALDIAVPFAASQWITCAVADGVHKRYAGRMSQLDFGAGRVPHVGSEPLDAASRHWMHSVRFGVLLVERTGCQDVMTTTDTAGRPWVMFDWWQWLRTRVPAERLAEAWLYMCHACHAYASSPERRLAGLDQAAVDAMAQEGQRLLDAVVDACSKAVAAMWETTPAETEKSSGHYG